MPIYEYQCAACGHKFEELVSDGDTAITCEKCHSDNVFRLMSLVSSLGMASACSGCAPTPSKCKGCAGSK
jgi:putative FmdB family regulatory protein